MLDVKIATHREVEFQQFLELNDCSVDVLGSDIYMVTRDEELPVFVHVSGTNMYFEVDLGNVNELADKDFYFKLLDLNTEILPVSFGINNTNPNDPRLVLVESRETTDLSDQELLAVFDALELAVDKAEGFISKFVSI